MYIYISTFNVFTIKCHTIILSKRFFKKIRLMKSLLKTALTKSVKTIPNLNHSKTTKE